MIVSAHKKYQIIQEMIRREDNQLNITWLCETAGVSRVLSISLEIDFVMETVNQLIGRYGISLTAKTLIHSDQGSHF